jgi:TolB-like protein/DNA-binding SARP family transcriptional activator
MVRRALENRREALEMHAGPQKMAGPAGRTAAFKLCLLGEFSLADPDGRPVLVTGKKNWALLAILALSPNQTMSRERLVGLLWADRGHEQARNSLRQSLAVLRRELGPNGSELIYSQDEALGLRAEVLAVDVLQFMEGSTSEDLKTLRASAALYRGDMLANLALYESSFADWLDNERSLLKPVLLQLFDRLSEQETGQARIDAAQRLVTLDPLREASQRTLMRALADAGEKGLALKQYEKCRDLLEHELGIEPAEETQGLKERILSDGRHSARPSADNKLQGDDPVYLSALASLGQTVRSKFLAAPAKDSIAVLPFVNISGDPEQESFTDGLTEDIITDLSNVPGFFVIARNSTFAYKGKPTDVRQIAHDLGVKYILEGNARRSEKRLRINVQLSDAAQGGNHVWAERFDRDLDDIFEVQDEVTRRVVDAIAGKLGASSIPERYHPVNLEAYDLCVRSRNRWAVSKAANDEAIANLAKAIALDPNYCEAHWQLANSLMLGWQVWGDSQEPNQRNALALAQRATEISSKDSTAHSTLGYMLLYDRRWNDAQSQYDAALYLNPNSADTLADIAYFYVMNGTPEKATQATAKALRLNPRPPGWYYWITGTAQAANGKYEDAVVTLRREETYRSASRRMLAAALALLGRRSEAQEEARLFLAASPHWRINTWVESQPFKNPKDAVFWTNAFRMAGLPE